MNYLELAENELTIKYLANYYKVPVIAEGGKLVGFNCPECGSPIIYKVGVAKCGTCKWDCIADDCGYTEEEYLKGDI